ncbi:MAG TPA: hypothetical protein VGC59_02300 [Solirubrobacteraceae bacterium]
MTRCTVRGLRENRPPVSATGSASMRSQASSTEPTDSTLSSGPKISSRSTALSCGSAIATIGAQYQPSSGTGCAGVTTVPSSAASCA